MSRFSHYDTDSERLPEGMERIGYDADTQTYTYRDSRGKIYEGAPGNEYGYLSPAGQGDDESAPFTGGPPRRLQQWEVEKNSWRASWAPLLNFFMLVALFLAGVGWLLYGRGSSAHEVQCLPGQTGYTVHKGDTCWALAKERGIGVEDLKGMNEGLDCDRLQVGVGICVPDGETKEDEKAAEGDAKADE